MSADKIGIKQYCDFLKGYVIPHVPKRFDATIAPRFRLGLTNDELEASITAFKEMLYNDA